MTAKNHTPDNLPHTSSIAIIGAGGLGRELRELVERGHNFAGYYDDKVVNEHYLGKLNQISSTSHMDYLIAVGDPLLKKRMAERLKDKLLDYRNIVSDNAVVSPDNCIGDGIVVCGGVMATVDYEIGSHVLLNLNVTIGHDVIIGNYCSIMPGANISGGVTIGEATLIGSGAVILQGITIGANAKVGAGAVVTKDVPDGVTVVGVPARRL